MKIVIVGAGRVGYAIAEQLLTEGHDITVVESDPERAAYISSTLDVIVVEGRANVDQLRIANVADADLLIAATTSDETNLISCMVGRKLGATHTIARVRDEEYYQDVVLLQDELGLSLSINPERTSAKEISRTLRFPAATKVEPFANGLVELVEFKLREGSKLDGLRLNDFRGRYSDGILICAVEREGSVTIPNGDFVLAAGDYVTVVGAPHELHELFRKIGEFRHEAESVIIVGGGRIAERLALELARMHIHSTIIERDPARCRVMKTLLPEATIICADGTKPDVLREEGLPEADALVTLTESDETNLIISSFAYHEKVPKIVTKVDEDNFIPARGIVWSDDDYPAGGRDGRPHCGVCPLDAELRAQQRRGDAAHGGRRAGRGAGIHRACREPVSRCAAQGAQAQGLRARCLNHPPRQVPRPVRQRCHRARRSRGRRHHQPWYARAEGHSEIIAEKTAAAPHRGAAALLYRVFYSGRRKMTTCAGVSGVSVMRLVS